MNTNAEIISQFLTRNNRSTTEGFITDATLNTWLSDANLWAAGFKKWPQTEAYTELGTFGTETLPYSGALALNTKTDSVRYLAVGDISDFTSLRRFTKINFHEYLTHRENYPDSGDRIFSDYKRTIYCNPQATDTSGTVYAFYQARPDTISLESGTTIFSNYDDEGNEALIEKMTEYLKLREHNTEEALAHGQRAEMKLEGMWKAIQAEQSSYQSGPTSQGMWQHFDVIEGRNYNDIFKRDQF